MHLKRLADDLADGHARVERRGGILENNLHFLAVRQHIRLLFRLAVKNHLAAVQHLARRRLDQTQDRAAERRLAAAGLAHDAERFTGIQCERNVLHRLDIFLFLKKAGFDREVFPKMPNLKKGRFLVHQFCASFISFTCSQQAE